MWLLHICGDARLEYSAPHIVPAQGEYIQAMGFLGSESYFVSLLFPDAALFVVANVCCLFSYREGFPIFLRLYSNFPTPRFF